MSPATRLSIESSVCMFTSKRSRSEIHAEFRGTVAQRVATRTDSQPVRRLEDSILDGTPNASNHATLAHLIEHSINVRAGRNGPMALKHKKSTSG
mmetsp:Transcript_17906/g.34075  ORF Transcript_17906/g.34075 Transcript_17906/m.34075 type:complete len:95 (-) Transcript_17906:277-561(-)